MKISRSGVLAALLALVVAGVCVRLGFWQLDRLEQRRTYNAAVAAATVGPALRVSADLLAEAARDPAAHLHRRAVVSGRFEHEREVLLRGRSREGSPGVHVVTPLRLADGGLILVNRGWLPSPDAARADPRPFRSPDLQRMEGILQAVPEAPDEALPVAIELDGGAIRSLRRLDRSTMAASLGEPIPPLYLQRLPDPGASGGELPIPVPAPALDEGSHLGYAIQWFSFAAIALGGLIGVAIYRRDRAGS